MKPPERSLIIALVALGCIYASEADARTPDLQRIAVDYGGLADDLLA